MLPIIGEAIAAPSIKQALIDQEMRELKEDIRKKMPDNPVLEGFKVYSQVDEDGIIEAIFRRLGGGRFFIEIGCGNGTENNTHYLALKSWQGVWIDGNAENINSIARSIPLDSKNLLVEKMFITRDNVEAATRRWVARFEGEVDLLSLDIDGNDAAVLERVLTVMHPRLLVLEYNGKYPPPLKLSVAYNPSHSWEGDDYYGSSLQVFVDQLQGQYRLVACGLSGANAYFLRLDCADGFASYPISDLYMRARHHLIHHKGGAKASLKHLRNLLTL